MGDFYTTALYRLGWRPVTLWYRLHNGSWVFNHLENYHQTDPAPIQKRGRQAGLPKEGTWSSLHTFLDQDNKVLYSLDPRVNI